MEEIALTADKNYGSRSKPIAVVSGKKYSVSTKVVGISGKPYSAFFGVILLNQDEESLGRRVQWLNDFTGKEKDYEIIFKVPEKCKSVRLVYRINKETAAVSECHYKLLPLSAISGLKEVEPGVKEKYDTPRNFKVLSGVNELTPEQEDKLERNLVWIFANPRSGTTWLGTQLLSHNTHSMDEPLIGKHLGELHSINAELVRYVDSNSAQPDYFFNHAYSPVWKYYLRKLILNRIYAQFKDLDKKIIIKEPNGSSFSDILSQCLPNSKAIVLIRDGRDVVDSKIDSLTKGGWGTKFVTSISREEERQAIVTRQSRLWIITTDFILKAFENHSKDRRILVRYEDLRANTHDMLKQLYQFIGVQITDDKLKEIVDKYSFEKIPDSKKGSGKFHRAATPGLWKQNFKEKEAEIMDEIMGDMLRKLGYFDDTTMSIDKITMTPQADGSVSQMISSPMLSPEQEDKLERNLVWIFANPRNAAIWLGDHLSNGTRIMREPLIGRHLGEQHESSTGILRQLEAHSKRPDYIFNLNYSLAWKHSLRKLVLNRIHAQFKDLEHKIVIVEPNGSLGADIISETLPNSIVVALVVDGRDIIESEIRETGAAERIFQKMRSIDKNDSAFMQKCNVWATTTGFILKAYEHHAKERRILIRYEDLAANTFGIVKKLYQLINIQVTDDDLRNLVDKHKGASGVDIETGRWEKEFSEERKRNMNEMFDPVLRKAGYRV